MCVIFVCDTNKPTEAMIRAAFETNHHGAGIAWLGKVNNKPATFWRKGLDLDEIIAEAAEKPLPYVLHFRIASAGDVRKRLCHPFPVTKQVDLSLESHIHGQVLFHNGHWNGWEARTLDMAVKGGWKIPPDKWSDTRAIAYATAHLSSGFLEWISDNSRFCLFGPTPDDTEIIGAWSYYEEGKFLVSNKGFDHKVARIQRELDRASAKAEKEEVPPGEQQNLASRLDSIYTTPPASLVPSQRGTGGSPRELPFAMTLETLEELWKIERPKQAGTRRISKKQYKRWKALLEGRGRSKRKFIAVPGPTTPQ